MNPLISWSELLRVSLLLLMALTLLAPAGGTLLARRSASVFDKKLLRILFSVIAMLVFNALSRLIDCTDKLTEWAIRVLVWADYSMSVLSAMFSVDYIFCYTTRSAETPKRLISIAHAAGCFGIALWTVLLPTGLVYDVDPVTNGDFGPLYLITQIPSAVIMCVNACVTLKYRKRIGKGAFITFLINRFCPLITMTPLLFDIGPWRDFIAEIAVGACALLMFCMVHTDQSERNARREIEMLDVRSRLMFIGLQPKFMLDTLNTIYGLCDEDPDRAQSGISDFSDYLRMNIDRMQITELMPFSDALRHIEKYLNLEKLRYEDRLRVVWDIRAPDTFHLPFLTVQPLVRNAVENVLAARPEGGTVTVRAEEREKAFEISVSDDGAGCDTETLFQKADTENSVSLLSVRNKIKAFCGGDVSAKSIAGEGTTVTITIPKEGRRT